MSCNCKKKIVLEDKYGENVEENFLNKASRFLVKGLIFLIFCVLAIVIIPIMVFMAIYQLTFGKGRIVLPKFLGKYMK